MKLTSSVLSLNNSHLDLRPFINEAEGIRSLISLSDTMNSCDSLKFTVELIVRLHQYEISRSSELQASSNESSCADKDLNVVFLLSMTGFGVYSVDEGVEDCGPLSSFHTSANQADPVSFVFWENDLFDELIFRQYSIDVAIGKHTSFRIKATGLNCVMMTSF
jgi:hypothetical protein